MNAIYDYKNDTTTIKLKKSETENNELMAMMARNGARFKSKTTKTDSYEAKGNVVAKITVGWKRCIK